MKQTFYLAAASLAAVSISAAAFAYSGEQYVTCKLDPNGDNFLALRSCGSSKCQMLKKLGPGSFMITLEPTGENGWREVIVQQNMQDWSYEGQSGWVYEKYICLVDHK